MKSKTMKRFKSMVKPYKKTIIIVTLMALFIDVCELVKPVIVKEVMEKYLPNNAWVKNGVSVGMLAALYTVLVVAGCVVDYINRIVTSKMGENVVYTLREKIYTYIERANVSFHDKTPSGKLFVRVINDTEDVYSLFDEVVTTLPKDIIIIVGLIGVMIYLSVKLSVVNLIIVPILLFFTIILSRAISKIFAKTKEARTKVNTFLAESIYGIKLIKIFNRQKEKQDECEKYTKEYNDSAKGLGSLFGVLPAIMDVIKNFGTTLIVLFCMNNWFGISLEPGIVYLFITYVNKIFEPINNIVESVEIVEDAMSSIDKIYDIIEHDEFLEDSKSGIHVGRLEGKIEFKNVWFAYEKDNWVLKDVSFTINPGESIALVGKTGSGKTTITNLINRFYTIQKGQILIDGMDIYSINLKDLRENIGTILQDPFIFSKSIKDNIKLYKRIPDITIKRAVKLASAEEFIQSLNNGIDEVAQERGGTYSAGQKQLIAFSRIFAKNPAIFVLDEATANIDTKTEGYIQKSVDMISADRTSIFIAHRLSTIVNVDKILVLNKGKIIEEGSHKSLLEEGGYYSKLYNAYYNSLL